MRKKRKIGKRLAAICLSLSLILPSATFEAQAAEGDNLLLHYDFNETNGTVVKNRAGNNYDGALVGAVSWTQGVADKAVSLPGEKGSYISIPAEVFKQSADISIAMLVKMDVVNTWSTLMTIGTDGNNYTVIAGKGNPSNKPCGITMGTKVNGGTEFRVSAPDGTSPSVNEWTMLTFTQSGNQAKIYMNDQLVGESDNMGSTIKQVVEASNESSVRLGSNIMFNDPSLDGKVDDLKIYGSALSQTKIAELVKEADFETEAGGELNSAQKVKKGAEYVQRYVDYILNDGYELLTGEKMDEYLGEKLECKIEWSLTSGEAAISNGRLVKTDKSAERQAVKLKAVVSNGSESETVTFENVTLLDEYVGYILSFFGGDDGQQKLHLGYSYDGINWKKLNDGKTVLPTTKGNGNVRDPYIMRKKDGSFAVVATQGWDTNSIYFWDSQDLVTYENERLKQVTYENEVGLTGRRAWAPEASYDPIKDQYIVYWSDPDASDGKGKTYANTSKDLNEFSKPFILFDAGYKMIDANIIKWRGSYYMVFKDERGNNTDGGGGKNILMAKSNSLEPGTFEQYTGPITEAPVEGPFMFKVNGENKWYHYYDYFNEHKFGVSVSTDLDSGEWEFLGKSTTMPTDTVQHGGAIAVTQKELNRIVDALDLSKNFLSMEAEYGEVKNGAIIANENMSNGHYVGNLGGTSNGTTTFKVNAINAGEHTLKIYYATANERELNVKVNSKDYAATCPATGAWTKVCETPQTIKVEMKAGENTIQLGGVTGDAPNIDRIEIELNASEAQAMMQFMVDSLPSEQKITLEDEVKVSAVQTTYDLLENNASIDLTRLNAAIEKLEDLKDGSISDSKAVEMGAKYVQEYVDYILNDGYELLTGETMDEYMEMELKCKIEWTLTEGKAVIKDGKLRKTEESAERQPVKLKAVVTRGSESKEVKFEHVTLLDEYVGYILSFFGGDDAQDQVHLGYSYDGLKWNRLNDSKTIIKTTLGNHAVRDPYIMRKKDGTFAVIATQGWDTQYIYLWDSESLVTFQNERLVKVAEKNDAIKLTGTRAWAPEATYDPIKDQYIVYWSDPKYSDDTYKCGGTYANTTKDLVEFSSPYLFFDVGYKNIDANIIKWRGDYYMDFKGNNTGDCVGIQLAKADYIEPETFQAYTGAFVSKTDEGDIEGPFMFQAIGEDRWYVYYDYYGSHKFGVSTTTDLNTDQWEYLGISETMPSERVQHGGVIAVTQKEMDRILAAYDSSENFLSVEAEYGELKGAEAVENKDFSNGTYVGNLGGATNGTSTFTVKATEASKHMVKVHYATAEERVLNIKVNGKDYSVSCPPTGDWTKLSEEPQTVEVELKAGENVIELGGVNGANAPNVDRIEIKMEASEVLGAVQYMIDSLPSMQEITAEDEIKFKAVQATYDIFENKLAVENVDILTKAADQFVKCQEAREQLTAAVEKADEVYKKGQGNYSDESWNTFVSAYQAAMNAGENLTVDESNNLQKALEEAQNKLTDKSEEPTTPEIPSTPEEPTTPSTPSTPEEPTTPGTPSTPEEPTTPSTPSTPEEPTTPSTPSTPEEPTTPGTPSTPEEPTTPGTPSTPEEPTTPGTPSTPEEPTTPTDGNKPGDNNGGTQNPSGGGQSENAGVKVASIEISGISKKIAAGKKIKLKAIVTPEDATNAAVIWTTDNDKYAKVDQDGVVTLKKAGKNKTVTITATAADGSGVEQQYKIKIMPNAVKKVTIQAASKIVKAGSSLQLKATVSPNMSSKKMNKQLNWKSSNKKYATVTSKGVVKIKKAGKGKTVKITAMSTDGSNKKATVKIKIQ